MSTRTKFNELTQVATRLEELTGLRLGIRTHYGQGVRLIRYLQASSGEADVSPILPVAQLLDWMHAYGQGWTDGQLSSLGRRTNTPRPRRTKRRQRLIHDMRFFRTHGGGIVGEATKGALNLARAERTAHDRGWEYVYYPEEERYEGVYGLPDPGGEWVTVALESQKGTVLASLGFVDANDHQYLRVVRAELAGEALSRGR